MSLAPFIIRNILEKHKLEKIQEICARMEISDKLKFEVQFQRRAIHNYLDFKALHHKILTPIACKVFNEKLIPSFCYGAFYVKGRGRLNYHTDREQCYRTINVCINQNEVWPIFVSHENTDPKYSREYYMKEMKSYKKIGQKYFLNIGDALCYSGTQHPHWRELIQKNNYCHLIFFNFVLPDFEKKLD